MFKYYSLTTYFFINILILFSAMMSQELIFTKSLYYNSFYEQLSIGRIEQLYDLNKKYIWLYYTIIFFISNLKFLIITLVIYIGIFFLNYSIKFRDLYLIIVKSEIVFIVFSFIVIFWFSYITSDYKLSNIQDFSPLSLMNFSAYLNNRIEFKYLLKTINFFEFLYILLISIFIYQSSELTFWQSFKLLILTYLPALIFWIICITFLTLNFT